MATEDGNISVVGQFWLFAKKPKTRFRFREARCPDVFSSPRRPHSSSRMGGALAFGETLNSSSFSGKEKNDVGKRADRALRFGTGKGVGSTNKGVTSEEGKHGVVNLSGAFGTTRGTTATASTSGKDGFLGPTPPPDKHKTAVTPRNAWPEGKFTIIYPKGYDPAIGRFVNAGDGGSDARVTVTKKPLSVRIAMEEQRVDSEKAQAEALQAQNLDCAYLARVTAQREEAATLKRKRFGKNEATTTTTAPAPNSTTETTTLKNPPVNPKPPSVNPALLLAIGVDETYMTRLAEQEARRRVLLDARAKKITPKRIIQSDADAEYSERYAMVLLERDTARARVSAGRLEAAREESLKAKSFAPKGKKMGKRQKR